MAAPSGAFVAGKYSAITVGSTALTHSEWSASYKGEDLDVTNFESNGYKESIIGILSLDWDLKGVWNTSQIGSSPPLLYPTDAGQNLILTPGLPGAFAGGNSYNLPQYVCTEGGAKTTANGAVEFTARGHSQGKFTPAT